MDINKFNSLDIKDKIDYINKRLIQGDTVIRIREDIGISEKVLQKEVKKFGYKYNQKLKQYISTTAPTTTKNDTYVVDKTTSVVPNINTDMINYLEDNFEILKEFIERVKATTESTTESTTHNIEINLVDDKHLSTKPKSIRINEFVYREWQEFCNENKYYSKQDLISMALKNYMNKYKK